MVLGRPYGSASPRPTTSPLRLLRSFEQRFGLMLDHLTDFLRHASRPILLLDAIYAAIDNTRVTLNARHLEDLVLLFIRTATPMWGLLGDWITRGMPISNTVTMADSNRIEADTKEPEFDEEFFIHRDRDVAWSDEDFWESAWVDSPDGWPTWLAHGELRSSILEAGKARGLLRTLELETIEWDEWQTLPGVLRLEECHSASIADILFGWLRPRCQIAQLALRRALDEECGLLQHLDAIEGILYGVAWEVLQEWSSWLCKQVRKRLSWRCKLTCRYIRGRRGRTSRSSLARSEMPLNRLKQGEDGSIHLLSAFDPFAGPNSLLRLRCWLPSEPRTQ